MACTVPTIRVSPPNSSCAKHLSPLCPPDTPVNNKGLERERFEALLQASRERNALVGAKKPVDLRKEIARRVHTNKLVERRALFLAKVHAPPSPTAATTPKTPPDSPAIFHYSLPSPGLVSPLAMFDSLHGNAIAPCKSIEQVDFRLVHNKNIQVNHNQVLPSLDQISARLKTLASARSTTIVDSPVVIPALAPAPPLGRPATIEIGRLKMPVRSAKLLSVATIEPPSQSRPATVAIPPPLIPDTSLRSDLEISTTVTQRTATASPAKLTESNLKILDARERRAHNMLSTLRRRTLSMPQQPSQPAHLINDTVPRSLTKDAARRTTPVPIPQEVMELGLEDRKPRWKRHSAPADFMPKGHTGFEHPVFAYPGAF